MREFQGRSAIAVGALFVGFVGWSLYGAIRPVKPISSAWSTWPSSSVSPSSSTRSARTPAADDRAGPPPGRPGVAAIVYANIDADQFIRRSTLPEQRTSSSASR